ncbi:DJ-1/PfpI family protein [Streptomyces aurantiacus]|uniref:DJ-1/PfpI family protein n=1 Tax=Streptomyces aurantiacus TaxID=47760 RepID=UPI0027D869C2|nr:DJ-1/PfpI family protein [Streptomyces aurantiacus]
MPKKETPRTDPPLQVAMLLFNGLTALDFIGPHTAFSAVGMDIHLVAENFDPVASDTGISITPTATFESCPARVDILFVPGGAVHDVLLDKKTVDFVAERGASTSYVTSVCTGSLILAAAGLLDGYRAATYWSAREQLARLGIEVSTERVCIDRNRFSGGGVTAGIDFGLTLVSEVLGEEAAKLAQLAMEYNPEPPFDAGSPEGAGPEAVVRFNRFAGQVNEAHADAVSRVIEKRNAAKLASR